ncbi:MAG: hypothetical protein JO285_06675 [Kutzneria sp.]|nr:hypothetical protein [Kutzneria sp.]
MTVNLDQLRALGHGGLRRVARGQIVSVDGVLRHHSDVLPPDVITALKALWEHGFITTTAPTDEHPRWPVAELTLSGVHLLDQWNKQGGRDEAAAAAGGAGVDVEPVSPGATA